MVARFNSLVGMAALVGVVVLMLACSGADAFTCYVCNSRNHTGCGSPPSDEHLKTCEDLHYDHREGQPFTVCRLQVTNSEGGTPLYDRRCGWIKHNENRETCLLTTDPLVKAMNCECHTDRCNGATSFGASAILVGLTVLSVALFRAS